MNFAGSETIKLSQGITGNILEKVDMSKYSHSSVGEALKNPGLFEILSTTDEPINRMLAGKYTDHLTSVHKNEPQVQEIMKLPKGKRVINQKLNEQQLLRQKLIRNLLKENNYKKILQATLGSKVKCTYQSRKD